MQLTHAALPQCCLGLRPRKNPALGMIFLGSPVASALTLVSAMRGPARLLHERVLRGVPSGGGAAEGLRRIASAQGDPYAHLASCAARPVEVHQGSTSTIAVRHASI